MTSKHLRAETWRVVNHGPHWDRATRTWSYEDRLVAAGLSKHDADALLRKLGGTHGAIPEQGEQ